jgi:hypothetical protein
MVYTTVIKKIKKLDISSIFGEYVWQVFFLLRDFFGKPKKKFFSRVKNFDVNVNMFLG